MARVLVVDRDAAFAHLLVEVLREHGHAADAGADVEAALARASSGAVDVVLLDWTAGDACRSLRAAAPGALIITTSARRDDLDEVAALDAGADGHLAKPFGAAMLEARIGALLRRADREVGRFRVRKTFARFEIERVSQRVWVDGVERKLTGTQFRLLAALLEKPGPIERSVLVDEAFGAGTHVTANCLDQQVRRLRRALGPAGKLVKTRRGVGYGLDGA